MRSPILAGLVLGAVLVASPAVAQTTDPAPSPPPAAMPPPSAAEPPESPPAAPPPTSPASPAVGDSPLPAVTTTSPGVENGGDLTGTPNPTALTPNASDELRFSSHGFIRAPLRIGAGNRPGCPAGVAPGTTVTADGTPSRLGVTVPCAGAGQSTLNFH